MLSTIDFAPTLYLKSSLPRLVEIQLMNAVLLHYGRELDTDGDPKEVLKLIADENIECASTPTDNPGSDVPREHVHVKMTRQDKVQHRPDLGKQRASVIGMENFGPFTRVIIFRSSPNAKGSAARDAVIF